MHIKISKGFDIKLAGKAALQAVPAPKTNLFAVKPTDFMGLSRPKLLASEGDTVKAGSPLFYDKKYPEVMYTSPVSGEVVEVRRGEKRKILEIRILADSEISYIPFKAYTVSEIKQLRKEELRDALISSGVWPNVIQRPYGVVANPDEKPQAIYVSTFDSHPLAPEYDFIFKGQEKYLQTGIDVLKMYSGAPIHFTSSANGEVSGIFNSAQNVEHHKISGPHPAGNVGVQIHHIKPIMKGDLVWTINPYGLIQIGKLFLEGKYDASKTIALAGPMVKEPKYYQVISGFQVSELLKNTLDTSSEARVISGNALTGFRIEQDDFLGYYDHLITVLKEGNKARFFLTDGWLAPISKRLSYHRALGLFSFLNSSKTEYALDTNCNGEERAFVVTGMFEKVVPMDIYPTHLIKAIFAKDYEEIEALGIYEVIEEDLALCEFVDVSKHEVQRIIREGIELLRLA